MAGTLFTCTMNPENRMILEQKKLADGFKLGETVNTLIATFGLLPDVIESELIRFIRGRLQMLSAQAEHAGQYEKEKIADITEKYRQIAVYLNHGVALPSENIKNEPVMREVPIKNGFLRCPKDYVIVNEAEASTMSYACVVECRNAVNYGIPHYLVYCDRKYGSDYDESYETMLLQKILAKAPDFQRIIDLQVKPIESLETPGVFLNAEEFLKSPEIGFFHVYERGDSKYPLDYKPPYGVEIVRNGK